MHVAAKSAAYVLLTISLMLVVGCDSSGSSGPPDSVEGTWTGSHSVSAEVDTSYTGSDDPLNATGQITRSYKLVIAESGSDLSVEITIDQTGSVEYERGLSADLDENISYSASGTYGSPTLVVTDVSNSSADEIYVRDSRWEFEIQNNTATGALNIRTLIDPGVAGDADVNPWRYVLNNQTEAKSLTLEKQ